jgi:hypothetical protein
MYAWNKNEPHGIVRVCGNLPFHKDYVIFFHCLSNIFSSFRIYTLRGSVTEMSSFGRNVFGPKSHFGQIHLGQMPRAQGITKRSQQPHQNLRAILPAPTANPTFPCFLRYATSESNNKEPSILINVNKKSLTLKLCVCVNNVLKNVVNLERRACDSEVYAGGT